MTQEGADENYKRLLNSAQVDVGVWMATKGRTHKRTFWPAWTVNTIARCEDTDDYIVRIYYTAWWRKPVKQAYFGTGTVWFNLEKGTRANVLLENLLHGVIALHERRKKS